MKKKLLSLTMVFAIVLGCLFAPVSGSVAEAAKKKTNSKGAMPGLVNAAGQVDFGPLQAYNPDIYSWIIIPGTQVNYPILQSVVDNYYIDKNVDLSKGYPGALYTNSINTKDYTDFNTVVYGHNMRNKTAFGSLHNFDDKNFFDTHQDMWIYTPDGVYLYQIVSTIKYSSDLLLYQYPNYSIESRQSFINLCKTGYANSKVEHYRTGVELTTDDKLVTLSTCISDANYRFLVVAKLVAVAPFN